MAKAKRYPTAVAPKRVGSYPVEAGAGGGYVWDDVLEYRVWCCPHHGAPDLADGSDYFAAFATYPKALAFSRRTRAAEKPVVLVRQREYIDEPKPGVYRHVRKVRLAEWAVDHVLRPRRTPETLRRFFAKDAPKNRLAILRGTAIAR